MRKHCTLDFYWKRMISLNTNKLFESDDVTYGDVTWKNEQNRFSNFLQ